MTFTREEILNQDSGQELSEWVAVGVMGFDPGVVRQGGWNPSEDISAAWEVVEKLSRGKTDVSFVLEFHYERYFARFGEVPFQINRSETGCEFAPEAICKAALLAVLNL